MVNVGGQEVIRQGQGHTRPKRDLEASRGGGIVGSSSCTNRQNTQTSPKTMRGHHDEVEHASADSERAELVRSSRDVT